jgi:ABC-type nickel/cobalt efflux system permease component RcnA
MRTLLNTLTNDIAITNTATVTGVTAALLMALNLNLFVLAYALFITSSVLWAVYAYRNNNRQLLVMNVIFSAINLVGLVRFS